MTAHDESITIGIASGVPAVRMPREGDAVTLATLAAMPLFHGASVRQLRTVAGLVGLEQRAPGDLLLREGVDSDTVLVIVDGWASATQGGRSLGLAGPGELLGDPSQLSRRTSAMTWTCDTDLQVLTATPRALREVYALLPQTYVRLTSTVEEVEALEARGASGEWSWLTGLLGTLAFLVVITAAVALAGSWGAFQ